MKQIIFKQEIPLKVPMVPNYIIHDAYPALPEKNTDVAEISDETLRQIGAQWTEKLLKNAATRRAARAGRTV